MSDLTFYGLDVLVIGVTLLLVARLNGVGSRSTHGAAAALNGRIGVREGRLAVSFGIPLRWWLALRAVILVVSVTAGVVSRVPVLIAIAVLGGIFIVPWSLEGLAYRRRIDMARDLGKALEHTNTRLDTTGQSLDVVLRDVASRGQGHASRIFAPLVGARDVDAALADSTAASGLPVAEDAYMVVACARTRPPQVVSSVINDIEVPAIENDVTSMEKTLEWRVGERAQALLLLVLPVLAYFVFDQMPNVHAYHASANGQFWLVVSASIFAASVHVLSRNHRMEESEGWDTVAAHRELEALRHG